MTIGAALLILRIYVVMNVQNGGCRAWLFSKCSRHSSHGKGLGAPYLEMLRTKYQGLAFEHCC